MNISSTGDLGDITLLLNLIRQIPGAPHVLCLRPSPTTKAKDKAGVQRLHDLIAPLALEQPYISEVRIIEPGTPVDWRSEDFRKRHYTKGETLMQAHLNHLIQTHQIGRGFRDDQPWLTVRPDTKATGRVVINRTGRYRNDKFPWMQVVKHYRYQLMFVGLEHEWREFCGHFGYVEFCATQNLLEVARLIAGSELFIGNQSCANACAEGLKHPMIQESSLVFPDCVYLRPNAQHVADGRLTLPDGTVLQTPPRPVDRSDRKLRETPPGYWQYPGYAPHPAFPVLAKIIAKEEQLSVEEAEDRLYSANSSRCPDFFQDRTDQQRMARFHAAISRHS